MKIALVVHTFFPKTGGGTEVYTLALANQILEKGHDVLIITCESNLVGNKREITGYDDTWQGIQVHRLIFNILNTPNPLWFDYCNPDVERYLKLYYADKQIELIHICHPGNLSMASATAAKSLSIPVILTTTDRWIICPNSLLVRPNQSLCEGPSDPAHCLICTVHQRETAQPYQSLVNKIPIFLLRWGILFSRLPWARYNRITWMVQALYHRAERIRHSMLSVNQIITPSRFLRNQLVANQIPAEKILVSAHGINTDWLTNTSQPTKLTDRLRFAFIGQIGWHKGTHVAVQAFNRLPNQSLTTLSVYGDHQDEGYFHKLLKQIDLNPLVTYHGCFPHSQIQKILSEIDVLLMPSLCYENTPTIMYEAFATKTPVIASDEGGMRELIQDFDGGWTFRMGDVDALRDLMQMLISNPQMVEKAQAQIRPVRTIDQHVQDVLQIYDQVLPAKK